MWRSSFQRDWDAINRITIVLAVLLLVPVAGFCVGSHASPPSSRSSVPPITRHRQEDPTVQIWDDLWTSSQCQWLHQLAVEHTERIHDDSLIFLWTPGMTTTSVTNNNNNHCNDEGDYDSGTSTMSDASSLLTPLEFAIASILDQLRTTNDDKEPDQEPSQDGAVVEYWCRQDYLDLELHSDIDEELFLQSSRKYMQHSVPKLRYPDFGHVLYLTANDKMAVGPTCIFPYKLGGWNVTANTAADDDAISIHLNNNEEEEKEGGEASSTPPATAMVVVPFVPGRLVRFPGSAMHGVPKPCNKWSLSKSEQQELEWLDEQVEDDDDSSVSTMMMRSVLLFNLWNETGPLGITTRMKDGPKKEFEDHTVMVVPTIPDGIVVSDEDDSDSYRYQQPTSVRSSCESGHQTASIQTVNSITDPDPFHGHCRPVSEWRKSNWINPGDPVLGSLLSSPSSPSCETIASTRNLTCLTIPLMGTKKRRFHAKKFVTLDLTGKPPSGEAQSSGENHPKENLGDDDEWGSTPTRFWLTERT